MIAAETRHDGTGDRGGDADAEKGVARFDFVAVSDGEFLSFFPDIIDIHFNFEISVLGSEQYGTSDDGTDANDADGGARPHDGGVVSFFGVDSFIGAFFERFDLGVEFVFALERIVGVVFDIGAFDIATRRPDFCDHFVGGTKLVEVVGCRDDVAFGAFSIADFCIGIGDRIIEDGATGTNIFELAGVLEGFVVVARLKRSREEVEESIPVFVLIESIAGVVDCVAARRCLGLRFVVCVGKCRRWDA